MLLSQDLDISETSKSKKTKGGLPALLWELSNDEDNVTDTPPGILDDPGQPWSQHFSAYMNASEQVPNGWSALNGGEYVFLPLYLLAIQMTYRNLKC